MDTCTLTHAFIKLFHVFKHTLNQILVHHISDTFGFFVYLLQVIQIYLKWLDTNETMPIHQLVGFERVSLRAKETLSWLITVRAENMAVWNESRGFYIEPGKQK